MTSGTQVKSLDAETVAPACLRWWRTWLTSLQCSQTKWQIPLLSKVVLKVPSSCLYLVHGPKTFMSSRKLKAMLTSCCRLKVTLFWKTGGKSVHPWGKIVRWKGPSGVWNVVRSHDFSTKAQWSKSTNKSIIIYIDWPMDCSAKCLTYGRVAASHIVTALSGWRSWTILTDSFFFATQNHLDW